MEKLILELFKWTVNSEQKHNGESDRNYIVMKLCSYKIFLTVLHTSHINKLRTAIYEITERILFVLTSLGSFIYEIFIQ
jgi:hypothetical protein